MADLGISISLDSAQYTRGLATVQQQTNAATASVSKGLAQIGTTSKQSGAAVSAFTQNLGGLGNVLGGGLGTVALAGAAGAALYKFGEALLQVSKESIEIASKVQSVNRALAFTAGGADAGAAAYSRFKNTANELGISIEANQVAYKNFIVSATQSGQSLDAAEKEFKQVAIAMTAMGLSAEDSNGVLLALGQIASKGVVSSEELRQQIGERLPGAFAIAARSIGKTEIEFTKLLESGSILSKDFLPKFTQELEKTFGATAQQGVNSYASQLNLLNNQIFELKTSFGEDLLPVVTDFFKEVTSGIKTLRELGLTGKDAVNGLIGGLKLAIGPIAQIISAFSTVRDLLKQIGINTNISINPKKEQSNGTGTEGIFSFLSDAGLLDNKAKIQFYKDAITDLRNFAKTGSTLDFVESAAKIKEYEAAIAGLSYGASVAAKDLEKTKKAAKELAEAGSLGFFEEQLKKINETFQNKKLSGSQITDLLGRKEDIEAQIKRLKELYGIVKTETEPATGSLVSLKKQLAEIQTQINEIPNDLNLLTALQVQAVATTASIKDVENQIAKAKRMAETGGILPSISGISNLPSQGLTDFSIPALSVPQADTSGLDKLIGKLNEVDGGLLKTQRAAIEMASQIGQSLGDMASDFGKGLAGLATGAVTFQQLMTDALKSVAGLIFSEVPKIVGLGLIQSAFTPQAIATFPANLGLAAAGLALLGLSGLTGGLIGSIGQQPQSIAAQSSVGVQPVGAAQAQQTAIGLQQANNAPQAITYVTVMLETNGIISEIQKQEYLNGQLKGL